MHYRTSKAENFHLSLMALLYDYSSDQKKLAVKESALNLDFNSIAELSINDHSHLIDALHLPFKCIDDREQAVRIAGYLMDLLISTAKTIPEALKCLLLQKNNAGFTPLHAALISANAKKEVAKTRLQ